MKFELKPYDVLFFRDGKPVAESGETFSVFPPSPETFYNAFRSGFLTPDIFEKSIVGNQKDELLGTAKELGNLELKALVLAKEGKPVFRCPEDVILVEVEEKEKTEKKKVLQKLDLQKPSSAKIQFQTDFDFDFTFSKKSEKPTATGFLSFADFENYLNGECEKLENISTGELYQKKFRHQNKLNSKKSTSDDDGQVFGFEYTQLEKEVSFLVELNSDYKEKYLRLGGDGKAVLVEETKAEFVPKLKDETLEKIEETKRFKLVTATPSVLENGWKARWMEQGQSGNLKFRLVGASVGKYEIYGGWDIRAKRPKPTFRCVPAGSVYFFELLAGSAAELVEVFHGKNYAETVDKKEFAKLGFGLTFVGI